MRTLAILLVTFIFLPALTSCLPNTGAEPLATPLPTGKPPRALPSVTYNGRIDGCGSIFVYALNSMEDEALRVNVWAPDLAFDEGQLTLEIADHPDVVHVAIDMFAGRIRDVGEFPYCNDVAPFAEPDEVWEAASGRVAIAIPADVTPTGCAGSTYEATVTLTDVVFRNGAAEVLLPSFVFSDITVGWCAG